MKKIKILGFLAFLVVLQMLFQTVAHAQEADQWQQVYSQSGDCKISFPTAPKIIQQSKKLSDAGHYLLYDVYLSPLNDKSICLLLIAEYPFALKKGSEIQGLEGLVSGIVRHNPDNQLVFSKVVSNSKYPTIDFLVQSSGSYFRGQAIMVGNKLYLIAIEGHLDGLNEQIFSRFASGFTLNQ